MIHRRLTSVALVLAVPFAAHAASAQTARPAVAKTSAPVASAPARRPFAKPADAVLKRSLTPLQYQVTQHDATETPYHNTYWNNHDAGIYVDVVSGEPLFSSTDKYESGTGWPSFTRALEPANVRTKTDGTLGMDRTEVRSAAANSHLGHVFDDGPAPTGKRFCMNSAAMRFIPADRLATEGYGQYAKLFAKK